MEKAVKLAAKRNLEQTSGTLSQNFVLMFSDSMINNNLRCLGINLGKTDEARVRSNEIEADVDISDLNVFLWSRGSSCCWRLQ